MVDVGATGATTASNDSYRFSEKTLWPEHKPDRQARQTSSTTKLFLTRYSCSLLTVIYPYRGNLWEMYSEFVNSVARALR
jgi:hypothetical protein